MMQTDKRDSDRAFTIFVKVASLGLERFFPNYPCHLLNSHLLFSEDTLEVLCKLNICRTDWAFLGSVRFAMRIFWSNANETNEAINSVDCPIHS